MENIVLQHLKDREHRKAGKWDVALEATDSRAKEILFFLSL